MLVKKKILGVILCRSDSTRLKGKIFKKINNKSLLENLITNVKKFDFIDNLMIASPSSDLNKFELDKIAHKNSIKIFFGKKNNVLNRLIQASKKFDHDFILRLNADNPFVSKKILQQALRETIKGNYEISTYAFSKTIPFGLSAVIFKRKVLEKIQRLTKEKKYLEHIENFCFSRKKKFKIHYQNIKKNDFYFLNCSVDNIEDLKRVKKIFKPLKKEKIDNVKIYSKKINHEIKKKLIEIDKIKRENNLTKYNIKRG